MKRIENIYEVVQRLCGAIEPQGESRIDEVIFQNLQETINVTEALIDDIILVARHKGRHEFSMSKVGIEADKFITRLRERLETT